MSLSRTHSIQTGVLVLVVASGCRTTEPAKPAPAEPTKPFSAEAEPRDERETEPAATIVGSVDVGVPVLRAGFLPGNRARPRAWLRDKEGRSRTVDFTSGVVSPDLGRVVEGSWSPDGALVLAWTSGTDGLAIVDTASGQVKGVLTATALKKIGVEPHPEEDVIMDHAATRWAPDARRVLTLGDRGEGQTRASVWNLDGTPAFVLAEHKAGLSEARWSPDGRTILTAGAGPVHVYDADSGRPLTALASHEGVVHDFQFLDDGRRVLTGGNDRSLRTYELASGTLEQTIPVGGPVLEVRAIPPGDGAMGSGQGVFLALVANERMEPVGIEVADRASGEVLVVHRGVMIDRRRWPMARFLDGPSFALRSGGAGFAVVAHQFRLFTYSPDSGVLAIPRAPPDEAELHSGAELSHRGQFLAAFRGALPVLYELGPEGPTELGELRIRFSRVDSLVIAGWPRPLVVVSAWGEPVKVFNARTQTLVTEIAEPSGHRRRLTLSSDERLLLSHVYEGTTLHLDRLEVLAAASE